MKKLQSATANESKHRKTINAAKEKGETNEKAEAAFTKWSMKKKAIQEEVARRKKSDGSDHVCRTSPDGNNPVSVPFRMPTVRPV